MAEKKVKGERNRFYNGYELAKYRKWRGVKGSWDDYVSWLINHSITGDLIKKTPFRAAAALMRYRWMVSYLGTPAFVDRNLGDSKGLSRVADNEFMHVVLKANTQALTLMLQADKRFGKNKLADKIVLFEEVMPPILMGGFPNLRFATQEPYQVMMPLSINQFADLTYIDTIESYGLPADSCRVSASICGAAIEDDLPKLGACIIVSNTPCDSGTMNSSVVARRLQIPSMPGCIPMRWEDEDAQEYAVAHVKDIISFIEDNTGEKFNWDTFFETVKRYNRETEIQMELWEYAKTPYYPLSCVTSAMFRQFQWTFSCGVNPMCVESGEKVLKICREAYEKKIVSRDKTRHRCLLWGASAVYYLHFSTWNYECWGINVVADMLNFCGYDKISTEDKDEALLGVAQLFEKGTMRRHLVGGYNHMLEMFELYEQFDCDMIMFYDDITCKGGKSMTGIVQDMCNERNIPLLWVSHDAYDPRTIPRSEMRRQVSDFMINVMHDEPLDPTLVDFDDSKGW